MTVFSIPTQDVNRGDERSVSGAAVNTCAQDVVLVPYKMIAGYMQTEAGPGSVDVQ